MQSDLIELENPALRTRRAEFWQGVAATVPLLVGAAPFGLLFGAFAVANGITPLGALALSAIGLMMVVIGIVLK